MDQGTRKLANPAASIKLYMALLEYRKACGLTKTFQPPEVAKELIRVEAHIEAVVAEIVDRWNWRTQLLEFLRVGVWKLKLASGWVAYKDRKAWK
jgi:hypothetical protein